MARWLRKESGSKICVQPHAIAVAAQRELIVHQEIEALEHTEDQVQTAPHAVSIMGKKASAKSAGLRFSTERPSS